MELASRLAYKKTLMPDSSTITESSWIKLNVRSAIAVVIAIVGGTIAASVWVWNFRQEANDLRTQMSVLETHLTKVSDNFWTVTDMADYGRESRVLNWSLVRKDEPNVPSGLLTPDARQIHKDNQL